LLSFAHWVTMGKPTLTGDEQEEWAGEAEAPFTDARYDEALDAFADDRFEDAHRILMPFVRDHPEDEDALALLADIDAALGKTGEAKSLKKRVRPEKDWDDAPSGGPGL